MDIDEIKYRMHHQKLYFSDDDTLMKEQMKCLDRLYEYNHLKPSQQAEKQQLMKEMFSEIGEGCYIETPFYANWGGKHIHIGNHVYANFNLTCVDDTDIYIGDHVMIGPNVVICTGTHPINPSLRKKQAQYNLPIKIGQNVWIGANCVIMPGVQIGDHTVIGVGSIVTKNIPANVVAYGQPCKVIREISEQDQMYYQRNLPIDIT